MSTPAYINKEIVVWARKRAGLTVNQLANDLKVEPSNIEQWEKGNHRPTFSKAGDLAKRLRIPFGYLFLSVPPADEIPLPDLRTVDGELLQNPSLDFTDLVQDVLLKQQWYSDYLRENHSKPYAFIGSSHVGASITKTADDIRSRIGITQQMRENCQSWEQFKTEFIRSVEDFGILVMRSGVAAHNLRPLSVQEFRGFAIVDNTAPLIFINSRDAKSAQTFTLAHELVHIWLGESGVSNPEPRLRSTDEHNSIERFCNRVAAELLVPSVAVSHMWNASESIDHNVRRLTPIYRVSRYVVARQAFELDKINRDEYLHYLDQHKGLWQPKNDDDDSDGNFYNTFAARNSRVLIAGVLRAIGAHQLTHLDASRLLGVKIATLHKIAERMS